MTTIQSDLAPTTRAGNWFAPPWQRLRRMLRRYRVHRADARIQRRRALESLLATADEPGHRGKAVDLATVRRYDWLLDLARQW